jgi:glycerophosphoryl diester phosphodiesterase
MNEYRRSLNVAADSHSHPPKCNDEELTVAKLAASVWGDFRSAWRQIVVFMVCFKLLEAWLIAPGVALLLSSILSRTGRAAITNHDLLAFLWSPPGVLYGSVFTVVAVSLVLVEQAGVMVIAGEATRAWRFSLGIVVGVTLKVFRIAQLGAIKTFALTATLIPFVVLLWLGFNVLLARHDIYFYWTKRPPIFWLATAFGILIVLAACAAGSWLYVRWCLALPIALFEEQHSASALRLSVTRVRGVGRRIFSLLLGWQVLTALLGMVLVLTFRLIATSALAHANLPVVVVVGVLLGLHAIFTATISVVTIVGWALLIRQIYLVRTLPERAIQSTTVEMKTGGTAQGWNRGALWTFAFLAMAIPAGIWAELSNMSAPLPDVMITAHRGHARAAPENTLSAIGRAIDSGADYAEIDVQRTADGVIVLLHDSDLMRVAGDPRRLDRLTLEEVRQLDVGRWFSPEFSGERVPTLDEAVELSRGKIKLNVELKIPGGADVSLAREVANSLRRKQFTSDCLVTSFRYDALEEVRQVAPELRTGLIVAHSVGDLSRLEIDAISVRADHLSAQVLHSAEREGMETHVWTVNDSRQITRFLLRGVDNLITSDPDLALNIRRELTEASSLERMILAARVLLQLDL